MHQVQEVVTSTCFTPRPIQHVVKMGPTGMGRVSMRRAGNILRENMGYSQRPMNVPVMAASNGHLSVGDLYEPEEQKSIWERILHWGLKGTAVLGVALAVALATPALSEAARSGGRVGGRNFSSRSHSSVRSSSSPFSGSATSSSATYAAQPSRPLMFNSFFFPTMGLGYGMGYGFGGGILNLAVFAFMFTVFIQVLQSMFGGGDDDDMYGDERVSVAKVQIGLLGTARGLQKDLDNVANYADTSSSEGLQYVLQETILALNRNPDYCIYGAGQSKSTKNPEAAENKFNELSLQERSKIQQETLMNVGGRSGSAGLKGEKADVSNELIVVTILVAAEGDLKIPKITSREELTTALNRLGGVREDQVMAVEVLWVPQDENDSYTSEELLEEYPGLYTL